MVFYWLFGYNKKDEVKEEDVKEEDVKEEDVKEEEPLKLVKETGSSNWAEDMLRIEKDIEDLRKILNDGIIKEEIEKDEWQKRLSPIQIPRTINKNKRKRKK